MITFRASILAAALAFAALASSPARADLIISCSGSGCSGTLASSSSNTEITACGSTCTYGDFTIGPLAMLGVLDAAGNLADTENLEVSSTGSGSITLDFTETNLTAGSVAQFGMNFTGLLSGPLVATRTFYLDPTNGGLNSILLGTCNAGGCSTMFSALESLSGKFSITEEIVLTAGAGQGNLSSDDNIFLVPEPATLSLFGGGLLALGAMARRRRKAAKQV